MSSLGIVVLDVSVCSIRIIQKLARNANNCPTLLEDLVNLKILEFLEMEGKLLRGRHLREAAKGPMAQPS